MSQLDSLTCKLTDHSKVFLNAPALHSSYSLHTSSKTRLQRTSEPHVWLHFFGDFKQQFFSQARQRQACCRQ